MTADTLRCDTRSARVAAMCHAPLRNAVREVERPCESLTGAGVLLATSLIRRMTDTRTDVDSIARRRVGTTLTILSSILLVGSGTAKLLGAPPMVEPLRAYGFTNTVPLVAALELGSGVLLLVRRTRSFGLLFASAFLGGAIATHVQHHEVVELFPAFVVLGIAWVGTWLKHPVTLWSY